MIRSPVSSRRSYRAAVLMAPLLMLCSFGGPAAAETRNEAMLYGGAYSVSGGFEDRRFAGANVDLVRDDITYHGEFATIDREESATFGAVGATWRAGTNLLARASVGTSTENDTIAPDLLLSGGVTFESPEGRGWAVSPSVTYRHYRSDDWETTIAVEGVRYAEFDADKGGYYVIQLRASAAPNSFDEVGYSVGATLTTVRANGLSFGLGVEAGRSQYDTQQDLSARTDFIALRPAIGLRLSPNVEVFARGEFADVDTYDVRGVMLGIKTSF